MDIGSLTGEISMQDTLSSIVEQAGEKVKKFAEEFGGLGGQVIAGSAVIGTAILGVGGALFGMAAHAAKAGEEVEAFNLKTGIAVQNIGPLKFAVEAAGGSLDDLNRVLMKMTLKEQSDQGGKFSAALKDLGINAQAFAQMDNEAKILALGEGFRKGAINSTNMADSMALMARGGANMIPILEKMTPELMAIAQQNAIIWTPETIEASRQFTVATNVVRQSIENITTRVGAELLPAMAALADTFSKSPAFLNAVTSSVDLLAHGIGYAVIAAGNLVTGFISLGAAFVNIYGFLNTGAIKFDQFFLAIVQGMSKIPGMGDKMSGAIQALTADIAAGEAKAASLNKTYNSMIQTGGAVYDTTQALGKGLLAVGTASDKAAEAGKNMAAAHAFADAAAKKAAEQMKKYKEAVDALVQSLLGETNKSYEMGDAIQEVIDSNNTNIEVIGRTVDAIDKLVKEGGYVRDSQLQWAAANRTIKGTIDALHGPLSMLSLPIMEVSNNIVDNTTHMDEMRQIFDEARTHVDDLAGSFNEFNGGLTVMGDEMNSTTIPLITLVSKSTIPQMTQAIHEAVAETFVLKNALITNLSNVLKSLPQTIEAAFTGGGGLLGAMKAIGVQLSQAIMEPVMKSLTKLQQAGISAGTGVASALGGAAGGGTGAAIAGIAGSLGGAAVAASSWGVAMGAAGVAGTVALGAATLGIGAAAVGVYLLIKHMKNLEKQVNPVREQFVQMHGGIAALNEEAAKAGVTLTALLNAKNPEMYKRAIDDLNAAFEAHKKFIEAANTALTDLLGAARDVGGKMPEAMQPAVQKLIDMGVITGNNIALFSELSGNTEVDFQKMQTIAGKYKIDLANLGPAFQSARLHDSAKTIINDFDILTRNGADVGSVLGGMSGDISKLVQDSVKFGVDIPENMKPWIERLRDSGDLVDENGQKITDLSNLKFAPPIVTEFQKIVDKLQELIDKLGGPLTNAIKNIPQPQVDVSLNAHWNIPALPRIEGMSSGGIVPRYYAAGSSRVLPFIPRPQGTDTVPAMLTPGETVTSVKDTQSQTENIGEINESLAAIKKLLGDQPRAMAVALKDAIVLLPRRVA